MLTLSPDDMRAFGYRVVDLLVDRAGSLGRWQAATSPDPETIRALLSEPFTEEGADWTEVLERARRDVFGNMMHVGHPRFLAFVPSPSNYVSAITEALIGGFNAFAGTYLEAAGPTQIELDTIDWMRSEVGLPAGAGGLFVSGGSMANLTALAAARHRQLGSDTGRALVYASDQTHSAIGKSLAVLGFGKDQIRKVKTDHHFRLDLRRLAEAIGMDRERGGRPFCVVANAGTTNTGAIDPLPELSEFCRRESLWLHADGAFGATAVVCERGRSALAGIDRVDSLALDPHKWLFQPFECACVLVRDRNHLKETFQVRPEYLDDVKAGAETVNFCDHGVQLTRSFRALKVWMSLKIFGVGAFRKAIEHGFELAEAAEEILSRRSRFEIVTRGQLPVITFRYRDRVLTDAETDRLQEGIVEAMIRDGRAMISSTRIEGRRVLRICTINPATTSDDLEAVVDLIEELGAGRP